MHVTSLSEVILATRGLLGWVTVVLDVAVQPLWSVTVTLYVPAPRPLTLLVVAPLLHKYVYGDVPPDALTLTEPFVHPVQVAFAVVLAEADTPVAG